MEHPDIRNKYVDFIITEHTIIHDCGSMTVHILLFPECPQQYSLENIRLMQLQEFYTVIQML